MVLKWKSISIKSLLAANTTLFRSESGTNAPIAMKMNVRWIRNFLTAPTVSKIAGTILLLLFFAASAYWLQPSRQSSQLVDSIEQLTRNRCEVIFSRGGTKVFVYDAADPAQVIPAIKMLSDVTQITFTPAHEHLDGDPPLDASEWDSAFAKERKQYYRTELSEYHLYFEPHSF